MWWWKGGGGEGTPPGGDNWTPPNNVRNRKALFKLLESRSRTCCRGLNLILGVLLVFLPSYSQGSPLNQYISYYEPVYYNASELAGQLSSYRTRRSIHHNNHNPHFAFEFRAHKRLFRLRLDGSAESIFSPDVEFTSTRGPVQFPVHRVVHGYIEDDGVSTVDGIVQSDGIFDGNIETRDGVFYVEPASRYFKDPEFPVVIYSESDVNHPVDAARHLPVNSVIFNSLPAAHIQRSSSQSIHSDQIRLNFQDGVSHRTRDSENPQMSNQFLARENQMFPDLTNQLYEKLDDSGSFFNSVTQEAQKNAFNSKIRRSADFANGRTGNQIVENRKTTCMLYLQADHLFYEKMGRSEEACIEVMTRHVQRVNSIYRTVDFDMDGKPDNISFMIKRVKVHTEDALEDPEYRFPGNYGVEKFLEIFSEEDYDAFCLAYMFTYRDFEGGTLGLAWTGDLKNAGGVCEKNGHYRGSFKSLNTGVITLLNYGKHVPPAVSHVTMAHEMGHNFGSPHDPETVSECVPGGENGNYIMFARATSGDKMNNKKFSPCSLNSINQVLEAKARGHKGCFKEPQMAICGNGVVEEGEECDCGWEEDCLEDCCWPQRTKYAANQLPCTLKAGRVCSPSQGPCCSRDCSYNLGNQCREDNGCRDESYCNGQGTQCPPSLLKQNKTVCNEEFVCFLGECTGSICLAYGMESCQCSQGLEDPETRSCELCCKLPGDSNPCVSSFQMNTPPLDIPDMFSKPGTPCNNYQGYCDVFQKCREVDPSGPLATLRKMLLSDQSLASLRRFLTNYWYSAVIAAIAVIALMVTIVKFCGKKTPYVQRRRRKPRSVHHEADVEEGGGLQSNLDEATVHPTTFKHHIPFLGKRYKKRDDTNKAKEKSRKRERRKSSKIEEPREETPRNRAGNLAKGLTKLIVALPPVSLEIREQRPKLKNRSQSVESETPAARNRSSSPTKSRKPKPLDQMKKLSKSATTLSKSFEKLGGEEKKRKRSKSRDKPRSKDRSKDKSDKPSTDPEPREVTIAKLGPFKMSLELRDAGNLISNHNRVASHPEKPDKPKPNPNKHRRRKSGNTEKEILRQKSEVHSDPDPSAFILKSKKDKSKERDTDKIIVSKISKSDRPRRDRSPEKRKESRVSNPIGLEDYRLTLNKGSDKESENSKKFKRSVSQPNPSPDLILNELTDRKDKRTLSTTQCDWIGSENKKPVKRSSTTREGSRKGSREQDLGKSNTLRVNKDVRVFDNLGFDKSPDMRRQRKASSSKSISELRDQLEIELRREKLKQSSNYSLIERSSLSDSSDSSDEKRKSPPTQTQSLSEESSGGGSRRTRNSFAAQFDSDSDLSGSEVGGDSPQFAANPYVRVHPPVLNLETGISQQGCEKTKEEKKELKKVEKNERGVDSIDVIETVYEDTDTCSIITDGMPSNHSFTSV